MDDNLIRTGVETGKKCTSCTKIALFVPFSALAETSVLANNSHIRVDKFAVKGYLNAVIAVIKDDVAKGIAAAKSIIHVNGFQCCAMIKSFCANERLRAVFCGTGGYVTGSGKETDQTDHGHQNQKQQWNPAGTLLGFGRQVFRMQRRAA